MTTIESTDVPSRALAPHDLIGTPELLTRLGISRTTVSRWRDQGLPSIGSGRLRRYRWGDVLAYLERL
jgi:predicted DNA-binding transcriptional regulator AlpA